VKQNRYIVCNSCDAMNPSFETICDQCGAPISDTSIDDSSQATESEIKRPRLPPPSTTRLIGFWMIALSNVIGGPVFAVFVLKHMRGLAGYLMFWGGLGFWFLWFVILYRVTRNYFFRGRMPE